MQYSSPFHHFPQESIATLADNPQQLRLIRKRLLAEIELSNTQSIWVNGRELTKFDVINLFDSLQNEKNLELHLAIFMEKDLLDFLEKGRTPSAFSFTHNPKLADEGNIRFISPYYKETAFELLSKAFVKKSAIPFSVFFSGTHLMTEQDTFDLYALLDKKLKLIHHTLKRLENKIEEGKEGITAADMENLALDKIVAILNTLPDDFAELKENIARDINSLGCDLITGGYDLFATRLFATALTLNCSDYIKGYFDTNFKIAKSNTSLWNRFLEIPFVKKYRELVVIALTIILTTFVTTLLVHAYDALFLIPTPEERIATSTAAIEKNPNDYEAYSSRGGAYAYDGKYVAAILDFTEAIKINPQYADAYFQRARAKYKLKDYQGTIADYDSALRIDPRHNVMLVNRGVAKDKLGRFQEAIQDYDSAIRIFNEYAPAFANRGIAKSNLGLYKEALVDLRIAIDMDEKGDYYFSAGRSEAELKNFTKAAEDFTVAIYLNHEDAAAYAHRGGAYLALGKNKEAQEDFEQATNLSKIDSEIANELGYAKLLAGKYKEAIEHFNAQIVLNPKHAFAYSNRGKAEIELGEYKEAIADYDKSLELGNIYRFEVYDNRGYAKYKLGDIKGAIADYQAALKEYPDYLAAKNHLKALTNF